MNNINFLNKIEDEISLNIVIDFDGVIHKNSKGFYDGTIYDEPIMGTKESLKYLYEKGFKLIIYTCKANPERPLVNSKTGIDLIWEWLENWKLKKYIFDVTNTKPRALYYIDDKAIRFNNWKQTIDFIKRKNI